MDSVSSARSFPYAAATDAPDNPNLARRRRRPRAGGGAIRLRRRRASEALAHLEHALKLQPGQPILEKNLEAASRMAAGRR
ncbi:MAG: hypothetical protein R3F11_16785 [Verrucomicrobiales bacterium]